jgi:hypothetical protein
VDYSISSSPAKAAAVCAKAAWMALTNNSTAVTVAFHTYVIVVITSWSSLQRSVWHTC